MSVLVFFILEVAFFYGAKYFWVAAVFSFGVVGPHLRWQLLHQPLLKLARLLGLPLRLALVPREEGAIFGWRAG